MDRPVLQAWGDESMRTVRIDQPSYLLGALVADPAMCDDMRTAMLALPRRGSKLHWRDLDDRARRATISTIADMDAYHVIVVAAPVDPRRQERARALCLERLAWTLDGHGVQLLTLEARPVACCATGTSGAASWSPRSRGSSTDTPRPRVWMSRPSRAFLRSRRTPFDTPQPRWRSQPART